ncbi:glycosyltransferase [Rudaeicoccus suwonensis]|uniref:Glycosyltransferase involved in cell wall biosynthesis n=1 Tax=Rudaeicoccus suwonensis TaxID=657409 RepID=A0A561E8U6_9MICO|nr:glycosyltransferase [Rudaeicoccus suwonensis]TWE12017.1 glycosyltransferase involved in cell wall biosynthesis [Rudaeicoccus suwonensis]
MKRVLVLNQFALPRDQSGGTRHIDLFGRVDGWTPTIVAGDHNYNTQLKYATDDARFRLLPVPSYEGTSLVRMAGWGLYAAQAAVVGVTEGRLDAVYASSPNMLTPVAGWLVARARRVPFIVEIRDLWPESIVGAGALRRGSKVHSALLTLERWIYRHADRIVVVTAGWEEHFESLGVPREKLTVIPNGTEVDDFTVTEERSALRTEFGFDTVTAVYAGAHGPSNGLQMVLDAARACPDVDFVLVGSGSEKPRLQDAAADAANVRFLDPLPKPELARLLAAADIGIHCIEPLPILTTGMSPNKLFDYMAAGLPTVSNAGEGLRAVVRDGEAGRTGAPDSLPELVAAVAAAGTQQRGEWAAAARTIVTERFSRSSAAQTLAQVLGQARATQHPGRTAMTTSPQVIHLTTAHNPTDNRIFRKECVALREAGIDVHVVACAPQDQTVSEVPIHALHKRKNRLLRMTVGPVDALRTVRRLKPSVLHVHDPELIPVALAWKAISRGKVVFDAHEDLPKQVMGKPYLPRWSRRTVAAFARRLEKLADGRCDAIVAATPSIARNFSNPRTVMVQNYPWLRDFPAATAYDTAPERTLSYVGGLSLERGAAEMVAAAGSLTPPAHITVAGPATADSSAIMADAEHVDYLGIRPATEVPGIVRDAQVGLVLFHPIPNHMECQPTKLFEYMAARRPFIASDLEYWRTMLGDFDCGLFVDPTDPAAVAAAMAELFDDPETAAVMGDNGRRAVEERFSFEGEATRLVAMNHELLES